MGCKLKFAVAGFRRQNIGRIGDLLKFQIKCKFRDGTDSFTGPYLIDLRGFIKRREAGIFPFYSGMFPLLLLINMYRVYRQILSNHPPTLP